MNNISIESATQLNKILSFLPENRKKKIPENIWIKIKDKTDYSYDTKINAVQDIKEENVFPETRKYMSFIFLNYLATEEEKEEYIKIIKNNEVKYQEFLNKKYSMDNLFKQTKTLVDLEEKKTELPVKMEKNFFNSVIYKIRSLFSRYIKKIRKEKGEK